LYHWMSEQGIYVNAPDWYFLDGTNKIAMGYREVNFALPRAQQIILNRQNIYDASWEKIPSMGWGFVPLTPYHGGDSNSTIEPLARHLDTYRQLMFQYYAAGIQACYRGPRLYDTDDTRVMVKETIDWYKKYRLILNSDVIHLRRPDGRDWDGILHVNPRLKEKGLALLYNPLKTAIRRTIGLPLYYTGLGNKASIRVQEEKSKVYRIDTDHRVTIEVEIPAEGYTWLVIE
ncbi:MAG: alpha-galactosidase, partial [Chitinophaga rupis]